MQKIRYELDPYNRLVAVESGLRGTRRVLDGNFRIGKGNTLAYLIKSPLPSQIKIPHQLKLKGNWSLTPEHELCLTLDKMGRKSFGDQLIIKGEIIDVGKNSLLFAATTRTEKSTLSVYVLELAGVWQADRKNRLTFNVDKGGGRSDALTFDAAWEIGDHYQIKYRYEKEHLTRRVKSMRTLSFQGRWDIKDKYRLSYTIDKNSGSGFDFKTSAGVFKNNYIKYEVGIALSRRKDPVRRVLKFFGAWKMKKGAGLVFEMGRGGKIIQSIAFAAEVHLSDKGTALFRLRNHLNRQLDAELELSREVFRGNGTLFMRLIKSGRGLAVQAGAGWRW